MAGIPAQGRVFRSEGNRPGEMNKSGAPAKEAIMKANDSHPNAPAVLLLVSFMMLLPALAPAQTCEVPLFVQQGSAGASVMILADNSGSMNEIVYSTAYNASTAWSGNFTRTSTYSVSTSGNKTPRSFNKYWPSTPSVYLVTSANGESADYSGNYLNWLFFHATVAQRTTIPLVTRIMALQNVLTQIVNRSSGLDFGLTIFNSGTGGTIVADCGTDAATLTTRIAGIRADAWTPLGETMEDILDYFKLTDARAPITSPCQTNFVLVVTDGLPTMDLDVSNYLRDADGDADDPTTCTTLGAPYPDSYNCTDYIDDIAYYMANTDLRTDMEGVQTVNTYTIGFNVDGALLSETATDGHGLYFSATNAVDLFLSIEFALQDIMRRISSGSAVAVVSTERGTDDKLYRGKFMPVDWTGYLECYELPYSDGDAPLWEAGQLLAARSPGDRSIFTVVGDHEFDFTAGNASNLASALGAASDVVAADLINWGRGEVVTGLRSRDGWVLGPIVHSTPVVVGPPADFVMSESYLEFYETYESRQRMVYVGANDGMLHAFDAASGSEEWAFVPEFALPAFEIMADSNYCHKYSLDQTVSVGDVMLNGTWRTVLLSGGREGGDSIFALDVTHPLSPAFLWQTRLPDGMRFNSDVEITSIGGEAVALVSSGLDSTTCAAWMYGYAVDDGELLGSVRLSADATAPRNKASRPAAIDLDLDDSTDLVYVADLLGEIHRFETNGSADPDSWSRSELYSGTQEITADVTAAYGLNGTIYVYVGTGAYLTPDDLDTTNLNDFLCVIDRHDRSTANKSDLVNQTSSVSDMGGADGWCFSLRSADGLRVVEQAVVVAETVIFTAFAPAEETCVAGGTSYLYQMKYDDGGQTEDQESPSDRETELGGGVASHPVVDLASGTVVVQSSDASITIAPIAAPIERMNVRSWQENYDHVTAPEPAQVQ
jgi:type IV pilus assembly protein PilY1